MKKKIITPQQFEDAGQSGMTASEIERESVARAQNKLVLRSIRLGNALLHNIVDDTKLSRDEVMQAVRRLTKHEFINVRAERKFTAYFPVESTPTGSLEIFKNRVREVGDDQTDALPIYLCRNCHHPTASHYQFNLTMPCCVKGCQCPSCESEFADINRGFRESKGFVDNLR